MANPSGHYMEQMKNLYSFLSFSHKKFFALPRRIMGVLSHWINQFCSETKQKTPLHCPFRGEAPSPSCNQSVGAGRESVFTVGHILSHSLARETQGKSPALIFPFNACSTHGHFHSHLKPKQTLWHWTSLLYRKEPFPTEIRGRLHRKRLLLSKMWTSMLMFTSSWKKTTECMVEVQPLKFGRNWFNFKLCKVLSTWSWEKKNITTILLDPSVLLHWGRSHLCPSTSNFPKAGHTCATPQCPPSFWCLFQWRPLISAENQQ